MMKLRIVLAIFACCALLAAPAFAAEPQKKEMEGHEMAAEGHGEMSAEQKAAMEAWQKAMTPGEPHQYLAKMAGDWNMKVTMWMDPSAPPQVSDGTAQYEMMMGGRYLHETVESTMMGETFKGMGMMGYDNVAGHYWSTWMDNMSTGMMMSTGNYDADTGALVMTGTYTDPMTGEEKTAKSVGRIENDDHHMFEMYDLNDGQEVKTMEIHYTRK